MTDEQIQKCADKALEKLKIILAKEAFEKAFKQRSFSGRNPELGKMVKCSQCGLRHRESENHTHSLAEATPKHYHPVGNPFWRSKPGKYMWIKELKKFMTLTR
jgi:hypothetical protein